MELKKVTGIDNAVAEVLSGITERTNAGKEFLSQYVGAIVTEESLAEWKKEKVDIKKIADGIKRERIDMEKAWASHLKPISDAYKDLEAMYRDTTKYIEDQLDEFEEKRRAEKLEECKKAFAEVDVPAAITGWFTFDDLFDEHWLLKGTSIKNVKEDISNTYGKYFIGVNTITMMGNKYEQVGIEEFRKTGEIASAVAAMKQMEEHEKYIAEMEAERKAREEAEIKAQSEFKEPVVEIIEPVVETPVEAKSESLIADDDEDFGWDETPAKRKVLVTVDATELNDFMLLIRQIKSVQAEVIE